jgi:hypothetical protein
MITNLNSRITLHARRVRFAALALATMLLLPGCNSSEGPTRVAVVGHVKLDGKPLQRGSIEFIPVQDTEGPKAAAEIVDGDYRLRKADGPVVGTVRIEINSIQSPAFALDDPQAHAKNIWTAVETNLVPPQYNQQSTITRAITEDGPNEFNFNISTGGQP